MALNILIGVGGTGAKIVEASLYLLSAGFGPVGEPVHVCLVDQDNSNGNVERTERLLKLLANLQADFPGTGANAIDRSDDASPALFSVPIKPLFGDAGHWRPADDGQSTLRDILRKSEMTADEQALFDLLYRGENAPAGEAEQTMDLAEGYRGRAHVGAAALVCALEYDSPEFLARVVALMRGSGAADDVRIFIAGSLFGGTGAAGFPTIARVLHRLRAPTTDAEKERAKGIQGGKIVIGGGLMLPYFQFGDPKDQNANVIRSAQLLPQARVAVEFYEALIEQEGVFDQLYVAGWDELIQLNYHEPGRGAQRNPALVPELIAALAASHFFKTGSRAEAGTKRKPLAAARAGIGAIGWSDLPLDAQDKKQLYDRLGGALRFALYWRYRLDEAISKRSSFFGSKGWVNELTPNVDWQVTARDIQNRLNEYAGSLLHWAGAMRLFSGRNNRAFGLWDGDSVWENHRPDDPANPIDLFDKRSEDQTVGDLDDVLRLLDANSPLEGAEDVYGHLTERTGAHSKHNGLGRLVAAVHHATRPFR